MAIAANVLVVACLGVISNDPSTGPAGQVITVAPDGGTTLLGGSEANRVRIAVGQNAVVAPDGGTILSCGVKQLSNSDIQPEVFIPDGGTILLGGVMQLRNPARVNPGERDLQ